MKSFSKRFEGRELEILHYINDNGGWPIAYTVMEHFGAKDVVAWGRYIDGISQELDFKFVPRSRHSLPDNRSTDIKLLQRYQKKIALLRTLARYRAEGKKLDREIEELEAQFQAEIEAWGMAKDYEPCDMRINV